MTTIESQIKLYNDLLLIEAFIQNKDKEHFIKNAFSFSQFGSMVKGYFENQIDPNDKVGSVINLLAPGAISVILGALGMNKMGILLGLIASAMDIDVAGMFKSVYNKIVPLIKSGKANDKVIDNAVNNALSSQDTKLTQEQANNVQKLTTTADLSIKDVLILRAIADNSYSQLTKGVPISKIQRKYARFDGVKGKLIKFSGKVIGIIFKVALAALGLNVATNVGKKVLDKPNAFDTKVTLPGEKNKEPSSLVISKQKRFPLKTSYHNKTYNGSGSNWIERYNNTTSGISLMLVDFAKSVYGGLNGLESYMSNSGDFDDIVNTIERYNIRAAGENRVFIPKKFRNKKQIVDHFIDDVANIAPKLTGTSPLPPNASPMLTEDYNPTNKAVT